MRIASVVVFALLVLVLPLGAVVVVSPQQGHAVMATQEAGDIPGPMLALYQQAAVRCPGLAWTVLAGVGKVETDHGRNVARSSAGAEGPMQFLPSTWAGYGLDANGDRVADIMDPVDAVHSAAYYLCRFGAGNPSLLRRAIWAYNHADWYVDLVLSHAARYGVLAGAVVGGDVRALLANPRLVLTPIARADLAAGIVDPRVVGLLAAASQYHVIGVSVFRTGHSRYVAGTSSVSNHNCGQAADIFLVDDELVSPRSRAARGLVEWLRTIAGPARPTEIGQPWYDLEQEPGFFANAAHQDHVHLGFGPRCP